MTNPTHDDPEYASKIKPAPTFEELAFHRMRLNAKAMGFLMAMVEQGHLPAHHLPRAQELIEEYDKLSAQLNAKAV